MNGKRDKIYKSKKKMINSNKLESMRTTFEIEYVSAILDLQERKQRQTENLLRILSD